MPIPTINEVKQYARTLNSITYPEFVKVLISGNTITIRTPESRTVGPRDMGQHFGKHSIQILYSDHQVMIIY